MPPWALEALLAMVELRSVAAPLTGGLGPERALARSVGMGGPVSPLLWCLGYDPLIEATQVATGADAPTYADDLMGEVVGPRQALVMQFFLLG
eukprot:8644590-Alexandrium_andersonii.AAC.1